MKVARWSGILALAAAAACAPALSSLKLGPGGLEMTSQVVGLLVLALSLGFFYLYIRDVYPIQIAGSVCAGAAQDARGSESRDEQR